jgi:hypothetical protein
VKLLKRFGFGLSILIVGTVMASSNALACDATVLTTMGMGATCGSLALGGNYNTFTIDETTNGNPSVTESFGGGSVMPSSITSPSLNGGITINLAWVYCVGLFTDVGVPAVYDDTPVSSNATVYGMLPNSNLTVVNNAQAIAFLLGNFAQNAEGSVTAQEALQAAIWTEEYNGATSVSSEPVITGTPGTAYYSQYQNDLATLNANPAAVAGTSLSTIYWFSPSNNMGVNINQPLVGASGTFTTTTFEAPTPEPTSILFFGTVLLIAGSLAKRKYSKASR